MNVAMTLLLAVVSAWDLPQRQPAHDLLRHDFTVAVAKKDAAKMVEFCKKGVEILPDEPTWRYNYACSLARNGKAKEALDELEKSIDLGYRLSEQIAKDTDFESVWKTPRFLQLVEYAKEMKARPLVSGPFARVPAVGTYGKHLAFGEQNVVWDFATASFEATVDMQTATNQPYVGDFYYNFDQRHSCIGAKAYPGITFIGLDAEGRKRGLDVNFPNLVIRNKEGIPQPVFGNCSRAFVNNPYWRSLTRALMTSEATRLRTMTKIYLSNQLWFFPSNADTAPIGTNGDVYVSLAPYWITTAGRSWSDLPYLTATIEAAHELRPDVKAELLKRGLLAPTMFALLRKSLAGVKTEADYLTAKAHPSAMPPNGLDRKRYRDLAKALTADAIPPLAVIGVQMKPAKKKVPAPELTYAGAFAWAYVMRSDESPREFTIKAQGAKEFAFVQTHGSGVKVKVEKKGADSAKVTIDPAGLSPTNRVDVTVVGRNPGTGWGSPSYVSFTRLDPKAPYSDPVLAPREPKAAAAGAAPKKLKVLMIGNSFSICVLKQLPQCVKSAGRELDLCSMYIGGCSLERHWQNAVAATNAAFTPYRVDWDYGGVKNGADAPVAKAVKSQPDPWAKGKTEFGGNIPALLKADDWDVVTLQQASHYSWKPETFEPFGGNLVRLIRRFAPKAEIVVQETWSYTPYDKRLKQWGLTPETMYAKVRPAYAAFADRYGFRVIPTGAAVQDFRKAMPAKDGITGDPCGNPKGADKSHLNREGEYLQACTWFATLYRRPASEIKYRPDFLTEARARQMRESADSVTK